MRLWQGVKPEGVIDIATVVEPVEISTKVV